MTSPPSTYAERCQLHRRAFALALELGITPREAEEKLRHQAAMERHREAARRLAAKMAAPVVYGPRPAPSDAVDGDERPQPWWTRD